MVQLEEHLSLILQIHPLQEVKEVDNRSKYQCDIYYNCYPINHADGVTFLF